MVSSDSQEHLSRIIVLLVTACPGEGVGTCKLKESGNLVQLNHSCSLAKGPQLE